MCLSHLAADLYLEELSHLQQYVLGILMCRVFRYARLDVAIVTKPAAHRENFTWNTHWPLSLSTCVCTSQLHKHTEANHTILTGSTSAVCTTGLRLLKCMYVCTYVCSTVSVSVCDVMDLKDEGSPCTSQFQLGGRMSKTLSCTSQ